MLAFFFQLRLSRISRLDAWVREYQDLLRNVQEWCNRVKGKTYTSDDWASLRQYSSQASYLCASLKAIRREPIGDGCIGYVHGYLLQLDDSKEIANRELLEYELTVHVSLGSNFISSLYR
jgi:hypothetical protein